MKNIFRVPVDNQHFKDTIETGLPFSEVTHFLKGEEMAKLQRISKDGVIKFWGSIPGDANNRTFLKLTEGDELLCYRSGNYIALCKIAFTVVNKKLAEYAWGQTPTGTTWELIYFLTLLKEHNILVNHRIINPSIWGVTAFTETLFVIGYEAGNPSDASLVSLHLTEGLNNMGLLNKYARVTSKNWAIVNQAILGRVSTGVRFAERNRLKVFADFINNLPE